jgi:hypothetical protein
VSRRYGSLAGWSAGLLAREDRKASTRHSREGGSPSGWAKMDYELLQQFALRATADVQPIFASQSCLRRNDEGRELADSCLAVWFASQALDSRSQFPLP